MLCPPRRAAARRRHRQLHHRRRETSSRVTQALGVAAFHIGPQIAPGVPWVRATDAPLSLALKSGNFGDETFFSRAQEFFHD
ncbi:nucleotide-binding domain containing protein [Aeromonas dhakensis]